MPKTVFIDGATPVGADYLNGRNNHNHRGEDEDDSNAKLNPEFEIDWGSTVQFSVTQGFGTEYRIGDTGGETIWWPDRLRLGPPSVNVPFHVISDGLPGQADREPGNVNILSNLLINPSGTTYIRRLYVSDYLRLGDTATEVISASSIVRYKGKIELDTNGTVSVSSDFGGFGGGYNTSEDHWEITGFAISEFSHVSITLQSNSGAVYVAMVREQSAGQILFDVVNPNSLLNIKPSNAPDALLRIKVMVTG